VQVWPAVGVQAFHDPWVWLGELLQKQEEKRKRKKEKEKKREREKREENVREANKTSTRRQ
jgi:hypothetical protein